MDSIVYSAVKVGSNSDEQSLEGSGFITYDSKGNIIIVTNAHIVLDTFGEPIPNMNIVFFNDRERHAVDLKVWDENLDIAILTLTESTNNKPLSFANSDNLSYGDPVKTIGNSAGLGLGVSSGAVSIPSTIVKYKETEKEMIQTDINLNHGGSGGPLVDCDGKVVGMMTLRYTGSNQSVQGISYAIPSNTITQYINKNA